MQNGHFLANLKKFKCVLIETTTFSVQFNGMLKRIGPGVLIAAAFIGPGTVTVCTLAGVEFGSALLWTMLISIAATMVLQEMAARLGLVTRKGLATVIKEQISSIWVKRVVLSLILAAILVGNATYEAGNIGGGTLGLEAIFGVQFAPWYAIIIGVLAFLLLWLGNYRILEVVFVTLVSIMSLSFIITAVIVSPPWGTLLRGMLIPTFPENSLLIIVALVGTTIVPYNLFLHTSLVTKKWTSIKDLKSARWDTIVSIGLGGLVSMSIIIAASVIPTSNISNALDLAKGLEPLYGEMARYFLGIGLFAAGTTSAITAPLAAAFVAQNCFGWKNDLRSLHFRIVWIVVLAVGVASLYLQFRPIEIIKFAQIANGLLLPIIVIFLVWVCNQRNVLGNFKNTTLQKVLASIIVLLTLFLGVSAILKVIGIL